MCFSPDAAKKSSPGRKPGYKVEPNQAPAGRRMATAGFLTLAAGYSATCRRGFFNRQSAIVNRQSVTAGRGKWCIVAEEPPPVETSSPGNGGRRGSSGRWCGGGYAPRPARFHGTPRTGGG